MRTLRELTLRLSKLEGSIGEPLVILIRRFCPQPDEAIAIKGERMTWTRAEGETVEQLRSRAFAESAFCAVGVHVIREVNVGVPLLHWGQ